MSGHETTGTLRQLADLLLDRHHAELPDLSRYLVLLPPGGTTIRFRRELLAAAERRGHSALVPPRTTTLRAWLAYAIPLPEPILSHTARELLLRDALTDLPDLCRRFGTWPLIDTALALFDELTLQRAPLPGNLAEFHARLADGYGISAPSASLDHEAALVHALWIAWNHELSERRVLDETLAYVARLSVNDDVATGPGHCYIADASLRSRAEIDWVRTRCERGHATLAIALGLGASDNSALALNTPARNDYELLLEQVYSTCAQPLLNRAQAFARNHAGSPAHGRLHVHVADTLEQEARAVELAVRRWYARGRRDIGVITNDRKLARRIRALLERAHITVSDAAGWALSTTACATAIARWCETLARNFHPSVLLDLLKSPFVTLTLEPGVTKRHAVALEQVLARRRYVTTGLAALRAVIARSNHDTDAPEHFGDISALAGLLDNIAHAAAPILSLSSQPQPLANLLDALTLSMERLGLTVTYASDDAGRQLLAVLDEMRAAANSGDASMTWPEFARWLQRDFERRRYRPPAPGAGVELMGMAESALQEFDAVVIAGATSDHLPGTVANPPFFNEAVRQRLGLPGIESEHAYRFREFRALLSAAPEVLITYRWQQDDQPQLPSPWVERLQAFHQLAYSDALDDPELHLLIREPATLLATHDAPLPYPGTMPAGRLPAPLAPRSLSASSYQQLVDCPYQFYAQQGLGLDPMEDPREEMEKSDFGTRVHRILQAFVHGAPGLPGPFDQPLTAATRAQAESLLRDIARTVFRGDVARRFSARGWQYRFEALLPTYLAWETERRAHWAPEAVESKLERPADKSIPVTLVGRADRLDRRADGLAVIDYKTGNVPTLASMIAGESVQLPFYALLLDPPAREIGYLLFDHDRVSEKHRLAGADLEQLVTQLRARLAQSMRAIHAGAALPAWGDPDTCGRCQMQGLCRKELWRTEGESCPP